MPVVVAMKTVTIHLLQSLRTMRTVIFPAPSLSSRKFQLVVNANLAKKLVQAFAR